MIENDEFNRRIEVVLTVAKPDLSLAQSLLGDRGWHVEVATEKHPHTRVAAKPPQGFHLVVVEIRTRVAAFAAVNTATALVRECLGKRVDYDMESVAVVDWPARPARQIWQVRRTSPAEGPRSRHMLGWVLLAGDLSPQDAMAQVEGLRLGRETISADQHELTPPWGSEELRQLTPTTSLSIALSIAAAVCSGVLAYANSGDGVRIPVLALASTFTACVTWLAAGRPRPTWTTVLLAVALGAIVTIFGVLIRRVADDAPAGGLGSVLGLLVVFTVLTWSAWSFGPRRLSRMARLRATWVLGAVASVPVLGRLYQAIYFEDGFTIPADVAQVNSLWSLAITDSAVAWLLVWVVVAAVFFQGVTYTSSLDAWTRLLIGLVSCCLAFVGFIGAFMQGVARAGAWSIQTQQAAQRGSEVESQYGLRGRLVCLRSVVADPAVLGGSIDPARAVLTFPTNDGRVWFWDPLTSRTMSVPADQVTTKPAGTTSAAGYSRCGATTKPDAQQG